jgi:hypothetical protein
VWRATDDRTSREGPKVIAATPYHRVVKGAPGKHAGTSELYADLDLTLRSSRLPRTLLRDRDAVLEQLVVLRAPGAPQSNDLLERHRNRAIAILKVARPLGDATEDLRAELIVDLTKSIIDLRAHVNGVPVDPGTPVGTVSSPSRLVSPVTSDQSPRSDEIAVATGPGLRPAAVHLRACRRDAEH